ncbi:hypothetical protein CQW23_27925 [Capsicum baccatum]|uniref:Uncharacterized protein n=1 Tax=Capsicum baccatum TaxID=33114 RepID=A0A2G2VF58_CAPBA|nr:hypothetical protein CQW23_27925 [Capsicum baccatum]
MQSRNLDCGASDVVIIYLMHLKKKCPTVDDDLNSYENGGNDPINMEDDSMYMEDFSLDSQDDEEDSGTVSQPGYFFSDETNFCFGQTFADKKELKMLLDAAPAKKYETSNKFRIYKYVGLHMCGVEHAIRRHRKVSSKLTVSVCINHFRDGYNFLQNDYNALNETRQRGDLQVCILDGFGVLGLFLYTLKLVPLVGQPPELESLRIGPQSRSYVYHNASYWMCWKESVIAKNIIRGTPEHGYACLSAFSHLVELLIPESSYSIMVNWMNGSFVYYFLAFGACIRGYAYMRKELKSNCTEAAYVLENMLGYEKWSRAHFPGNRYNVITTNITESLNSILMDEWEYPMSYIFNLIARKFGEKFREWHVFVDGKENIFVPYTERILRDSKSASYSLYVSNPNGVLNQYTGFGNNITSKVNLLERSYFCRKIDLVKMSYEHAMAALRAKYDGGEGYGNSI